MALNREGLDLFAELIGFLDSGVCGKAEFRQFLKDDPIVFHLEIDNGTALHTGHLISAVKPDERFKAFMAALRVRAIENHADTLGGRRVSHINRDHGVS